MKKVQFPIYKEIEKHFPLSTERNIRIHFFICSLMHTQMFKMAQLGDEYEGNYIKSIYARYPYSHKIRTFQSNNLNVSHLI